MKRETLPDGKTRTTVHYHELVGKPVKARDIIDSNHPLHNEFRAWFCERHGITNSVDAAFAVEKGMTRRQASKFLRATGKR